MGYELHITRKQPIALDEWCQAVQTLNNAKLAGDVSSLQNLTIGHNIGDVLVLEGDKWIPVLLWKSNGPSFNARVWESNSTAAQVVRVLAKVLNAQVVGDEGESYSLD